MFSPVNSFETNSMASVDSEMAKEVPFNVKWLAKHFKFDDLDVQKAKFDEIGVMFGVYFKSGKESVAQKFYDNLVKSGCNPQNYEFNNSIHLNKYQKEKILAAALSILASSTNEASGAQEESNPLDLLASRELTRPAPRVDLSFNAERPQKSTEPPFDLLWLKEHYKLDVKQVKTAKFSSVYGCGFEIEFEPHSHLARNAFIGALTEAGCEPDYSHITNRVELTQSQKEKIILGSTMGKTFIPPIENEEAIDPTLRKGILLVKFFLDVLPAARSIKWSDSQDYKPGFELRGDHYQEGGVYSRGDYAKKAHFLKEIEPDLSFIRGILSNPEYKKKLEYYFITETNLISKLERFVKSKSGNLSLSLDNAC